MTIEYQAKKPGNLAKINSNDTSELIWWSYILMVPIEKLLAAIDEVGNLAEKVKKTLKENAR